MVVDTDDHIAGLQPGMGGWRTVFDAADDGARIVGQFESIREIGGEVLDGYADTAAAHPAMVDQLFHHR